jgi:chromosomal replication initiator protein
MMAGNSSLGERWEAVKARLRREFGEAVYRHWLEKLSVQEGAPGTVQLVSPTRFAAAWIERNYLDRIRQALAAEAGARTVEILCAETEPRAAEAAGARAAGAGFAALGDAAPTLTAPMLAPGGVSGAANDAAEPTEAVSTPLDPRFTFENFIVGKPNELAHAASRRVAESETPAFNPLFLYGGVGLGKTHLMHAIGWAIKNRNPGRKVLYVSAEKFMYRFVKAIRFKDTMAFKEFFRSVDVLMIDDVQFIAGKESTQEEFFHTFNDLVDRNRQIVISADKSPSDLEGMDERLRSRLGWGLVADIHPTTYELRLGILNAKAEQMGLTPPPKVLEFLAHKITSNIRELEGALRTILAHAELVGRPITLESTQDALRDLLRANDRRITIEEIQRKVAQHFNIRLADMSSQRRARAVARPRQVAMYLAKQLTARSLPEIGRKFGDRDHTTVMHAVRKIEEIVATDKSLAEDVDLLRKALTS